MIKEFIFSFSELNIKKSDLIIVTGYEPDNIPQHFKELIDEAFLKVKYIDEFKIAFVDYSVDTINNGILKLNGIELNIGIKLSAELDGVDTIYLFLCTAGEKISNLSYNLCKSENPVLSYIFDILGTIIVEKLSDKVCEEIRNFEASRQKKITNRYSTGFCGWPLIDQFQLFTFFENDTCGIKLTESGLMDPIKSVSGIVGSGENVKFRNYNCNNCNQKNCLFRKR